MAIERLFKGLVSGLDELSPSLSSKRMFGFEDIPTELTKPEIIGGQKALMNYARNATDEELDMMEDSMKLAKEMAIRGASFEDQVARTGMGYGPDFKLRFEIPDTNARFTIPPETLEEGEVYRVSDLLSHPQIYDYYPDLKNKNVRIINEPDKPQSFGAYNYKSQTIDLNIGSLPFIDKDKLGNPQTGKIISGLLHEVQHYAQQTENFLRGSNRNKFLKKYTTKSWEQASTVDKEKAIKDYLKTYGEAEARNVQYRFEDPYYAKATQKTIQSKDRTKGKNFVQTMGQDEDTRQYFRRSLGPTEFINEEGDYLDARLDYRDPFFDTTKE